ncbi:hypothetical protein GGH93_005401 [Coemansia aciculifera]|nr:hypothetical protein GGH93_005401 [Coemansia aciculifera]
MQLKALVAAICLAIHMAVGALGRANVVGYYPNWIAMPTLNFNKYTHVNFAFAIPTASGGLSYDNQAAMPGIVTSLHAAGTKAIISIGGWTGSGLFSPILKSTTSRAAFLGNIVAYVKMYNLDGVDIDWEYPGRQGDACNVYDANSDTSNFLAFLQDLRTQMDTTFGSRNKLLTLAVRVEPFDGPSGPVKDVSAFAKIVDYINLMTYDIAGVWNPTTSPNAPLQFAPGQGPQFSVGSAIDAWSSAGWPTGQMNLGIPFYGYAMTATKNMLQTPSNMYAPISATAPQGDKDDNLYADPCSGGPAVYSGAWQWKHLRDQALLTSAGTAASPWVRTWDSATSTPWLFNPNTNTFITYDDPQSIQLKVNYAASKGLAGTMVWSMDMDYNDELLSVLQTFSSGNTTTTSTTTATSSTSATSGTVVTSQTSSSAPSSSTMTSTSISSSTTSSSAGGPVSGAACSIAGTYQCADTTGKNASYFLCLYGKWLAQSCGSGTACFQSGSSVTCGWPV